MPTSHQRFEAYILGIFVQFISGCASRRCFAQKYHRS